MANTNFGVNDALAVKLWARRLEYDIIYRSDISSMIGTSSDSIIHLKSELGKEKGDQITYSLMKKLQGDGFGEGETATGNGESLSLYSDALLINELGHLVHIPNNGRSIDAQRVPINLRQAARVGLRGWKSERMSVVFFNHVCGNTAESRGMKYTGNNAIIAPSRHIHVDATGPAVNSSDSDIVAADKFDLNYIDYAREKAEDGNSPLRPINVQGVQGGRDISGGKYVMYLHPYQVTDLRTNTDNGQWLDIQKSAMQGGKVSNNPIYTDALGEYNNVIIKKSNHVTTGVDGNGDAIDTVRRAVLLGAQACATGFAKGGPSSYNWNEELIDHKRSLEVSMFCIYGIKKTVHDGEDFGVVTVSSYAAKHTN